ncbi:MAG: hypothetical protein K2W91_04695 [Novosphingobium sp.]|nr:hypothetical protein [Novosphingobium sp.]
MATYYALQQAGTLDGSAIPANKTDGRIVGAKPSHSLATKDYTANNAAAPALAANDLVYIGRIRQGEMFAGVDYLTDTTWGAVTVSVGPIYSPTKFVNAQTQTAINTWTPLPTVPWVYTAGPTVFDEDIYVKVSGAVAAATITHWMLKTLGVR